MPILGSSRLHGTSTTFPALGYVPMNTPEEAACARLSGPQGHGAPTTRSSRRTRSGRRKPKPRIANVSFASLQYKQQRASHLFAPGFRELNRRRSHTPYVYATATRPARWRLWMRGGASIIVPPPQRTAPGRNHCHQCNRLRGAHCVIGRVSQKVSISQCSSKICELTALHLSCHTPRRIPSRLRGSRESTMCFWCPGLPAFGEWKIACVFLRNSTSARRLQEPISAIFGCCAMTLVALGVSAHR